MFLLAVKLAQPALNSPLVDIYKDLVEALQNQKASRGDMFTAVLDKGFQSGILSQSLDC